MAPLLEVHNVTKTFDGVRAVDGLSLAVERSEVIGLIGPNGAGKTTLFNLVSGFLRADEGSMGFGQVPLSNLPPHRIARLGIGRTFQDLRLVRRLSVLGNVMLAFQGQVGECLWGALAYWPSQRQQRANLGQALEIVEFVGLNEHAQALAENLSYGQQKLLAFACCLATDADLLLLDEPVAGIEPETTERLLALISQLPDEGKSAIVIEHNMHAIREVARRLVVMDEGRKIAEGSPDEVLREAAVLEAYLT